MFGHFIKLFVFTAFFSLISVTDISAKTSLNTWSSELGTIEDFIQNASDNRISISDYRKRINKVHNEAIKNKNELKQELESTKKKLEALGPKPQEGEISEPVEIASKRVFYMENASSLKAKLAEVELTITRTEELERKFSSLGRERLLERLFSRDFSPLSPVVIIKATPEFFTVVKTIIESPVVWYESISEKDRKTSLIPILSIIIFTLFMGWGIRKQLLCKFSQDSSVRKPSYAKRLTAAFMCAMARGVIPAIILAAFFYWLSSPGTIISGLFADILGAFLLFSLWMFLVKAFSRVVLAPDVPTWRLVNINPLKARKVARRINILALLVAIDAFLHYTAGKLVFSEELTSFYTGIINALELMAILTLTRKWIWTKDEEEEKEQETRQNWLYLRSIVKFIAIAGITASLAGYINLGAFLFTRLIFSGFVIGLLLLARGLVHDAIFMLQKAEFISRYLELEVSSLKKVYFWLHTAVEPVLAIVGLLVLLPGWGVPREDVFRWTRQLFTGFSIGEVTISLVDITLAVIAFMIVIAGSRLFQRIFINRILSESSMEKSLKDSLSSGIGYIGVILASATAIIVVGIDLANIAMIAGALSVGIGFGLQNIVNNFVSGIIIIIERPIKIGDWVRVNEQEGFVKQINIRATEIETWQKASIIIPNAEILSNAVTNLTHKDSYGRIEIAVGVAYGSDTEKVREILLDCAKEHPDVLGLPEPYVQFRDFGDSSLNFMLLCYTKDVFKRRNISSDLRFEIDRIFRKEKVEIPFPQRVVHMKTS